ncbi:hypothetical protein G9A89_013112 [Geosiphon pyriformis]|nr:hypothetical protein G9A89_013112 [Geosiphon pyriformis]
MTKELGGLVSKERFNWVNFKASISEQALKGGRSIDETKKHNCEFIGAILETETSNKDKQKVKQYSRTTPNTPILPKTTAKHLQTPEQGTKPISTSANIIDYLQENKSNHSKNLESEETESEPEEIMKNKKEMTTAYIAKISEFTDKNNNTSPQEWLDKIQKAEDANETNEYYSNAQILDQFIAGLKDKLIKKVHPHIPTDLTTAIRHAKNYKMAMKKANHTKLTNLQRRLKTTLQTNNSSSNHKNINHHNNATKTTLDYYSTTNLKIVIIVKFQNTENKIAENCKETNKTGVINITLHHNKLITNLHYQLIIHQDHKIKTNNNNKINPNNQLVSRNSGQQRLNHYHTQPSYFTMPEKSDFQQPALFESEVIAPKSNFFNNIILSAQIAQNANLSDIFPFEFEANKSPFLLSNAAANKQKAITVMYTKAIVEGKLI